MRDSLTVGDAPLVTTAQAARMLGVGRSTLHRWWADEVVTPAMVTPGGHARWDMADLKRQIADWRKRLQEQDDL